MSTSEWGSIAHVLYAHYSLHRKRKKNARSTLQSYYIRLQTEGHCEFWVRDHWQTLYPGDLLLLKPGEIAQVSFSPDKSGLTYSGNYYVAIRGGWLDDWWNSIKRPRLINIQLIESLLIVFKELSLEFSGMKMRDIIAMDSLLRLLCLRIDRVLSTTHNTNQLLDVPRRMLQFIEKCIHSNIPISVKSVAEYVNLSESRASQLFTSTFKISMIQYCLKLRLQMACDRMQHTDDSMKQIAEMTGFSNYPYFCRSFTKQYGISPKEYRVAIRTDPEHDHKEKWVCRRLPSDPTLWAPLT